MLNFGFELHIRNRSRKECYTTIDHDKQKIFILHFVYSTLPTKKKTTLFFLNNTQKWTLELTQLYIHLLIRYNISRRQT